MAAQTIKLAGRKFVILPESQYRALRDKANGRDRAVQRLTAQDRGDITEARRRLASKRPRPYTQLRKELGLA